MPPACCMKNRGIVEAFLSAHPEFKLLPAGEVLAQQKIPLEMGEYLQLLPQQHGTDGFFAAVMERHKAAATPAASDEDKGDLLETQE